MPTKTIFIYLINEGTEAWRPVSAVDQGGSNYKILEDSVIPNDEEWEFLPGDEVFCEERLMADKRHELIAVKYRNESVFLSPFSNIWERVILGHGSLELDIYYLNEGFPKQIHDLFGSKEVERFRHYCITQIRLENRYQGLISRVMADAYAISSYGKHLPVIELKYQNLRFQLLKKALKISG